jgi:hypothetical protein
MPGLVWLWSPDTLKFEHKHTLLYIAVKAICEKIIYAVHKVE